MAQLKNSIPKSVLQNVRRIQITTTRLVSDFFAGQYHSVFKGQGIEFDEVREYQPGDEIRSIDWNVTARMGHPYVKKFVEERELTVMLLLDVSASSSFGSVNYTKGQLAAEICSLLAFSAIKNNDKVGFIAFTDKVEKFIPPRKGTKHVLRVIREALFLKPSSRGTSISNVLQYLDRVTPRRTVTFIISDFYDAGYVKLLGLSNKRHDIIAVSITDPLELDLPDAGLVNVYDAESGEYRLLDTSSKVVRRQYREKAMERFRSRKESFDSVSVDSVDIRTNVPYLNSLRVFFTNRGRKVRRNA